jgi:hypothetical protein
MATERDLELLDDYLANRMQGEDKSVFENKLQADPELQSEMVMQQRLIKAIKEIRVAELKQMLNNTPVAPVNYGTSPAVVKFVAGTVVAGLVATGLYLYFDKETPAPVDQQQTEISSDSNVKESETAPDEVIESEAESKQSEAEVAAKSETKLNESPSKESVTAPAIDVYDPSSETDVEEPAEERRGPARAGAPSISVKVNSDDSKYDFHYQFKEGRLVLFGPFERNLYEILEIFSEEKRTVFLFYKKNYYLLKDDNENVQELESITDQSLIRKIKEYQSQK